MSNNEILEKVNALIESNNKLFHLFSLQNEIKMLKYELGNGMTKQKELNMDDYYIEIKCRICNENKKVVKDSTQHKNSICRECNDEMLDDYESDNEIC